MNNYIVFDIEADNLVDKATRIHCIVAIDTADNKEYSFHDKADLERDGTVEEGIKFLMDSKLIVAHNLIGYDKPLLHKLYPELTKNFPAHHDTYILSQMFHANDMQKHSIDAWGKVFGREKPKHEDWENFSLDMLHRCVEDTYILLELCKRTIPLINKYNCKEAVALEYKVYSIFTEDQDHWYMNVPRLEHFIKRLSTIKEAITVRVREITGHRIVTKPSYKQIFKKDGTLTTSVLRYCEETGTDPSTINGPFERQYKEEFNVNSNVQIVRYLLAQGWTPEEYNYIDKRPTTPKLTNSKFLGINPKLSKLLVKYQQVKHRIGVLNGWNNRREGDHIRTFAYTCGTPTARFRHAGVANIPRASEGTYCGRMMRSLFVAQGDQVLVGCDAAQLEARVEGSYCTRYDKGAYAKWLLTVDIHAENAREFKLSRSMAKAPGYALQYGCGFGKIASLLGCSNERAKEIRNAYWDMRPAAKRLKKDLTKAVEARGFDKNDNLYMTKAFIKGLDGRPIFVRSWHSLTNSLIQSAGMIIMKVAYCYLHNMIKKEGLNARYAIFYHDEFVLISSKEDASRVLELSKLAMKKAGEYCKLNIPILGEGAIGNTWGEVH